MPPLAEIPSEELTRRQNLNAEASNMLYCVLYPSEFNCISSCTTIKEFWERLEVTFEGNDRVKMTKMDILLGKHETFEMKPDETITKMYMRYYEIVNGLANQGKTFTSVENVNKLLRVLPNEGVV